MKSRDKVQGKMWSGRFDSAMAKSMTELSFSLDVDKELLEEDIQGSLAHGKGLVEAGVISKVEYAKIAGGLRSILADIKKGKKLWNSQDEDIHMAVERVLTRKIGNLGKKIHTGRSRNDQIATDFKLYMRHKAVDVLDQLSKLQKTVCELAQKHAGHLMPGYTHLQQAQPIQFSHYLMSMFFALERDRKRLSNFLSLHNECPLGSGAMAGSAFSYNRKAVAADLGFADASANSIDAVSHRDMALEFLSDLAITGSTLSRYAEDMVIWSSSEFGFLTLHDKFSSGSSMMPQKKNPDSMELLRGKSGRLIGNFTAMFTLVKGTPLTYSRDLQEDKLPVFDSARTILVCLQVFREALETAKWNFENMEKRMLPALLATDLADLLVKNGIAFRDAHHIVGNLVGIAAKQGLNFTELSDEHWKGVPKARELRKKLTFAYSVSRRNIEGGTGEKSLEQQLKKAKAILGSVKFLYS
ncbi:MAG: argininosuccinate lyase [Candidatus Fibromonas sp.]|jgi:argininosuccinate lyase|nr:argininosuccinate lyase [Candidatus Fibromonas sp.]